MDTLLVVDDDQTVRQVLRECLAKENFNVYEAATGKRLVEILGHQHIDAFILDMNLPDGHGLDFLKEIRRRTDVPVIILSGDREEKQRVSGLDQGADDYVCKPFNVHVLAAKIRANLRRYRAGNSVTAPTIQPEGKIIRFSHWTLDSARYQIFDKDNTSGDLTVREFHLLYALASNAGKIMKRENLSETIREKNYVPTARAIDVKISRIRKKIGDDAENPSIIKTVRGIGYLFNPETIHT